MELNDENFEREIKNSPKPVLVDFFAEWCNPCSVLGPILEKLSKESEDKFILAKADINSAPAAAQKFGVERIPTVILFKGGEPFSGFVGLYPEPVIKQWLGKKLSAEKGDDFEKAVQEYEEYAKQKGFSVNPNKEARDRIIKGLFENKKKYGQKYCPCRRVTGNPEEDKKIICPCIYHCQEIEKLGHCVCGLFVK